MDTLKLKRFLKTQALPAYRYKQINGAVFKQGIIDWQEVIVLPKNLRQALSIEVPILSFSVEQVLVSKNKQSQKSLIVLKDGLKIETVLINSKPGLWSCCVSTQVGCAMGCLFCATGKMGFKRNLTIEEIIDQVLFWRNKTKLTHVVYMGMGEPLANRENVFESIRILINPDYFGIGQRNISVSTSGFAPGIVELAKNFPQINLAISLHAPTDELRSRLMPMNEKYPLEKLISELKRYFQITNRKVFLEYILLAGINDEVIHAWKLADLINKIGSRHLLHVNLIVYNQTDCSYRPPTEEVIQRFKNDLEKLGVSVTIRKSLGQEISAACGQLATV
jgi:23S rRNA (adenine(2503)-C(2))-methyltransferase